MASSFHLEKTYLDCIDANGNCFIVYSARIKFLFFRLNYSALLFSGQHGTTNEVSSFLGNATPIIGHQIKLANPRLGISGNWSKIDHPVAYLLFKDSLGRELVWNCHHPKADAQIVFNDISYTGLGYAETISLSFPPQRLPIDELRWGRFLSKHHTIIWIHWKGPAPMNKIYCDGQLFEDGVFDNDRISFGNSRYTVSFEEVVTLTRRKLSTLFTTIPFLKIIFSKRVLNTEEVKYKADSSFSSPGNTNDEGYSLFEIVTFKK